MRVIVVRHYKTVNNVERRIMGWGDAPPAQDWEDDLLVVDDTIRRLGIHVDAYYSSALGRARETARYYAGKRGTAQFHAVAELNEVNYGELCQRPKRWVAEHYREYKTDPDFVFPHGESFRQMQQRSVDFVLSLQRLHGNDTVLLVAHAGVIRGLICHFLGLRYKPNLKRNVSHRYIGEFNIEHDECTRYDELGKPSGFVKGGVVKLPFRQRNAVAPVPIPGIKGIAAIDRVLTPAEEPAKPHLGG